MCYTFQIPEYDAIINSKPITVGDLANLQPYADLFNTKPEPVAPKPEPVAPKPEPVAPKPEPVAPKSVDRFIVGTVKPIENALTNGHYIIIKRTPCFVTITMSKYGEESNHINTVRCKVQTKTIEGRCVEYLHNTGFGYGEYLATEFKQPTTPKASPI